MLFDVLSWIGAFFIGTGILGTVVYQLFKIFGVRWLDAKFDERLEAYKHEQQKELEALRFKISTLMDRTIKLHQREFDVLPEVWGRLSDAFNAAHPVALGFLEYADVGKMASEELDEFLQGSPLTNWQKGELKRAADKSRYYGDALARYQASRAFDAYRELHGYLSKHGIFMPDTIKDKFLQLDEIILQALSERRYSLEYRDHQNKFEKGIVLHEKGPHLLKALEQEVQGRLWNSQSLDALSEK